MKKVSLMLTLMLILALCVVLSACGNVLAVEKAYAEAQNLGYEGTLDEFVALLGEGGGDKSITAVGLTTDGALKITYKNGNDTVYAIITGEKGEKGDTGAQGIQGEKGDTGEQGLQGEKGATGATGATGPQGLQGLQGLQGEQGEKGDTGLTGEKGAKGEKGDTGEQGLQGETGVGIKDVDVTYGTTSLGEESVTYTITLTDNSTVVKTVLKNKEVINVDRQMITHFPVLQEGEECNYEIYFCVEYVDNTFGYEKLTPANIYYGSVDFYTVGEYYLYAIIGGQQIMCYVNVYNPEEVVATEMRLLYAASVDNPIWVLTLDEIDAINDGTFVPLGLTLEVEYSNGTTENVPVQSSYIVGTGGIVNVGQYGISINYADLHCNATIRVVATEAELNYTNQYLVNEQSVFIKADTEQITTDMLLVAISDIGTSYARFFPITYDMLAGIDNTTYGFQSFTVSKDFGNTAEQTFNSSLIRRGAYVYQESIEYDTVFFQTNFGVRTCEGVPVAFYYLAKEALYYYEQDGSSYSQTSQKINVNTYQLTQDAIVGEVDFSTAGIKIFKVNVNGRNVTAMLTVYNPYINNIMWGHFSNIMYGLAVQAYEPLSVSISEVSSQICGAHYTVNFIEESFGGMGMTVIVEPYMLDFSQFDNTKLGKTYVIFNFCGYQEYIEVNVETYVGGQTLLYDLTMGDTKQHFEGVERLYLYENGIAESIMLNPESQGSQYSYELNDANDTLILYSGKYKVAMFTVSQLLDVEGLATTGYIADPDFSELTPIATYTYGAHRGYYPDEIKLYDNGFMADGDWIYPYVIEGDLIFTYAPFVDDPMQIFEDKAYLPFY